MKRTTTKREEYAENLTLINELRCTCEFDRNYSFKEAEDWLNAYENYRDEGYSKWDAADIAQHDYEINRAYVEWKVRMA